MIISVLDTFCVYFEQFEGDDLFDLQQKLYNHFISHSKSATYAFGALTLLVECQEGHRASAMPKGFP